MRILEYGLRPEMQNMHGILLIAIILCLVSCAHTSSTTTPGKYIEWNGLIDELEIIEPFNLANYSRIVVLSLDTKSTPLPEKSDDAYEDVAKILFDLDNLFVEDFKERMKKSKPVSYAFPESPVPIEPGVLIIRGKVVTMRPGSRAARLWLGHLSGLGARTIFEIQGEVVDAQSDKALLKFRHGRSSGGMRDAHSLLKNDIEDVAKDIAKMLLKFQ